MVCSDCHSPHPTKASKVKVDAFKGVCVTCHLEKAGPFIFEHDPVAGFTGSGCQECHKPHGTNNPKMLNSVTRGLCAKCHTDKLATHFPGQTCWTAGCHVASHGSNTSPVFLDP
jgi:predicted CXXCH cytochrome family protein